MIRSIVVVAVLLAGASFAAADSPTPTLSPTLSDAEAHAACVRALNADPKLAAQVVDAVNEDTKQQHLDAADHIAKNERHVILAYAAMWLVSAAFVGFLWRRQQLLRLEIARLRRDLDDAAKDPA